MPKVYLSTSQGDAAVSVEVVSTPATIERGLMFREHLPPDQGMLFLMQEERAWTFWMRNTKIPLSIAFADASGKIVRIADMEPFDERQVSSIAPARYALEMNHGWFAAHSVVPGDAITDIPNGREP